MARKKSPTLTEVELRLMRVLWTRGKATVSEVAEALKDEVAVAYSTVLTMMRILENKGYVRHEKDGRAFVYEPVIDQQEACRKAVRHLVSRFFDNSHDLLVLSILKHEKIESKELKRLKKMIDESS